MDRKQQVSALPIDAQERAAIWAILYERAPALDKRIARGDDFAGDAWVRWVAVGHRPDPLEAHAANAYPKLVEALHGLMFNYVGDRSSENVVGQAGTSADYARDLLRSLGEE